MRSTSKQEKEKERDEIHILDDDDDDDDNDIHDNNNDNDSDNIPELEIVSSPPTISINPRSRSRTRTRGTRTRTGTAADLFFEHEGGNGGFTSAGNLIGRNGHGNVHGNGNGNGRASGSGSHPSTRSPTPSSSPKSPHLTSPSPSHSSFPFPSPGPCPCPLALPQVPTKDTEASGTGAVAVAVSGSGSKSGSGSASASRRENDKSPVISIHSSSSSSSHANRNSDVNMNMGMNVDDMNMNINNMEMNMNMNINMNMEYLTHTPMPKFEKKFRKEIIRPISTLLGSDVETAQNQEQEDILQCVRIKVYTVLQGMFLDVKERTYGYGHGNGNDHGRGCNGEDDDNHSERGESGRDENDDVNMDENEDGSTILETTNITAKVEVPPPVPAPPPAADVKFTAPGMEHIPVTECAFHDPEAERVCREKLLPLLLRILMRMGGKEGKDLEFLSFPAEDLVNCILLDFMSFVAKVLQLGVLSCRGSGNVNGNGNGNGVVERERERKRGTEQLNEHNCDSADGEDNKTSVRASTKKRRRDEMEGTHSNQNSQSSSPSTHAPASTSTSSSTSAPSRSMKTRPNAINVIGNELLNSVKTLLATESCLSGLTQSRRIARGEEWQHCESEREATQKLLPFFYKGTVDATAADAVAVADADASPDKFTVTANTNTNTNSNTSENGCMEHQKNVGVEGKGTGTGNSSEEEEEDEHGYSRQNANATDSLRIGECTPDYRVYYSSSAWNDYHLNAVFGRHCTANIRFFVHSGGLENLVTLVSMGLEDVEHCDGDPSTCTDTCSDTDTDTAFLVAERVDVGCFKSAMCIVTGVSYFASLGSHTSMPENGHRFTLHISKIQRIVEPFRLIMGRYLDSIDIGLNVTKQSDIRVVLDILSMMEDFILSEEEWNDNYHDYNHNHNSRDHHPAPMINDASKDVRGPNLFISPIDVPSTNFDAMKISMLWRFLTGENHTKHKKGNGQTTIVPPSLQCQVLSLNELRSWLHFLDNKIREFETHYETEMTKSTFCSTNRENIAPLPMSDVDVETRQIDDAQGTSFPEIPSCSSKDRADKIVNIDDNSSTEACCNNSDGSVASITEIVRRGQSIVHQSSSEERGCKNNRDEQRDVESISSGRTIEHDIEHSDSISKTSKKNGDVTLRTIAAMRKRLALILDHVSSTETNFMKHLFTSGLHSELLKRVLPLIQFLARFNCIKEEGMKLLWDASGIRQDTNQSQHESVTSAVLDILTGLVNTKDCWGRNSMDVFNFISELLGSVEMETSWTPQMIALLEAIVRRSFDLTILGATDACNEDVIIVEKGLDLARCNELQHVSLPIGFDVLWGLADGTFHNDGIVKREVAERAFAHLLAIAEIILATPSDAEYGPQLSGVSNGIGHVDLSNAEQIIMHRLQSLLIERTFSVLVDLKKECRTTNVRMLHFILSKLPSRGQTVYSTTDTEGKALVYLEDLLEKYDMKVVLTRELIQYASDAKQGIEKNEDDTTSVNDKILVGNAYSHYNCVAFREGLFQCFICRCTQVILAAENPDVADLSNEYKKENSSHKRSRTGNDLTFVEEEEERLSKRSCNKFDSNKGFELDESHTGICNGAIEMNNFSSLLPSESQISEIWSHYVSDGLSSEAQDCILGLFHYLLCSRDLGNISRDYDTWRRQLASTLYPLCCNIGPSVMSVAAYQLFVYCLGHVNAMKGIFSVVSSPSSFEASLTSDFLLGMYQSRARKLPYLMSSIFPQDRRHIAGLTKYSIQGLELLWQIILENNNEEVAEMSMRYLATIYTYRSVSTSLDDHCVQSKEQKSFMDVCFSVLGAEKKDAEHFGKVRRILCLVRLFIDSIFQSSKSGADLIQTSVSHGRASEIFSKHQVDDIIGENPSFLVHINEVKGRRLSIECIYGRNTSVGFLRRCIRSRWAGYGDCRLIFNGAELKDERAQLYSLGIRKDTTIHCVLRLSTEHVNLKGQTVHVIDSTDETSHSVTDDKGVIGEQNHGENQNHTFLKDSMAKQEMFANPGIKELVEGRRLEVLFSLLSAPSCVNEEVSAQIRALVWNLLQILPTETDLEAKLVSMLNRDNYTCEQDHEWERILPSPSTYLQVYKLLYALQAMEHYILPSEVVFEEEENAEKERGQVPVVDRVHASQNKTVSSSSSATPLILIDDESSEGQMDVDDMHDNEDDKISKANEPPHNRTTTLLKLRKNGGMRHLVKLLTCLDMGEMLAKSMNITYGQKDQMSLLVICSNKVAHLLWNVMKGDDEQYNSIDPIADQMRTKDNTLLFGLVNHLLKLISWSVSFQEKMVDGEDNNKAFKPKQSFPDVESLVHVSGSLTIQCLHLLEKLVTFTEERRLLFLSFFCGGSSENNSGWKNLRNAIISSVIKSPTREARSRGFSVFKELFLLHRDDSKIDIDALESNKEMLASIPSKIFALLASLLPFRSGKTKVIDGKTLPRFKVLFTLFVKSLSSLWSTTELENKEIILCDIMHSVRNIRGPFPIKNYAPEINHIKDIGKLLVWLLQDVASLLYCFPSSADELHLVGSLSMIRSILDILGTSDVKSLISNIVIADSISMLQLLLTKCTFDRECQSKVTCPLTTRMEIVNLIKLLCQDCESNTSHVLTHLLQQIQHDSPRNDLTKTWSFDPSITTKSDTGLVGLRNQGATCYMNSLLQQLFHIPSFRDGILYGLDSIEVSNLGSKDKEECRLMFSEFQKLLGHLLLSSRRDYNTVDMVQSIRGYDGRPIRPGEQQDVDEFFNLFTDRLESALKGSSQHRLLHNVFGGQLSHLVTCKECGFSSERVEDCLSISLDVKGKKDITESLNSYIQGDLLDGSNQYFCTKCDAKRDSVKRCCIKALPNVLICHLKRFEFDLEMLRKVKVNDRFQFPSNLDLRDYTKEGIDGSNHDELSWRTTDYYQYTLRGVLVHTGTADSGHYYSLCSVRNNDSNMNTNLSSCNDGDWFCFNDSTVTPFDVSTLDNESFGGTLENDLGPMRQTNRSKGLNGTKVFNAYLLIYDRVDNLEFDEQVKNNPKCMSSFNKASQKWETQIIRKNNRFNIDSVIFSPQYRAFLADVCSMANSYAEKKKVCPSLNVIQLTTYHLLDNYVHSSLKSTDSEAEFSRLCGWYQNNVHACIWLLQLMTTTHQIWAEIILLHCTSFDVRLNFVRLMSTIFKVMAPLERKEYFIFDDVDGSAALGSYGDAGYEPDCDDDLIMTETVTTPLPPQSRLGRISFWKSKSTLAKFIGQLIELIDECSAHWKHFDQLFEILHAFARCGHEESVFLIRCGVILKLVDFYLGESSNVPQGSILRSPISRSKTNERYGKMGDRNKRPNFSPLLSLLSTLARSANVPYDDDVDVSDSDSDEPDDPNIKCLPSASSRRSPFVNSNAQNICDNRLCYLPRRDARMLSCEVFFEKILAEKEPNSLKRVIGDFRSTIAKLLSHMAFGNMDISLRICSAAGKIIADKKADEASLSATSLMTMVQINDQCMENRISCALTSIMRGIEANIEFEKEIIMLLDTLIVELASRANGDNGLEAEVLFHKAVLENLEEFTKIVEQHPSNNVKQKYFTLVRMLLPNPRESTEMDYHKSSDLLLAAYGGESLENCYQVIAESERKKNHFKGKVIPCTNIETVKDKVFDILTKQLASANNAIKAQNGSRGYSITTRNVVMDIFSNAAFSEYFLAIRECLAGPQAEQRVSGNEKWIVQITKAMLSSFWKVEEGSRSKKRYEMDILKGEMMRLFERLIQLNPAQFLEALSLPSASDSCREHSQGNAHDRLVSQAVKFLDVYVTAKDNDVFNNTYTVHFYNILEALGDCNDIFLETVLKHDNFTWAISAFVLDQRPKSRGRLYNSLLCCAKKYSRYHAVFRRKLYKKIIDCSVLFGHNDCAIDVGALELLVEIFRADERIGGEIDDVDEDNAIMSDDPESFSCISSFVSSKTGGMSRLSMAVKNIFTNISNSGDTSFLDMSCLGLCLSCMLQVLRPLLPSQVKKVMTGWPELDETNFVLTQIITQSEHEWHIDCSEMIIEVVNLARNVQNVFLSTETTKANKQ